LALRHATVEHGPLLRADAPLQDDLAFTRARVDAVHPDDGDHVAVAVDTYADLSALTLAGQPVHRLDAGRALAAGVVLDREQVAEGDLQLVERFLVEHLR